MGAGVGGRGARRTGLSGRAIAGVVVGGGYAAALLFGCIDLFHSTSFGSCNPDAADGGCADAAASDARTPSDATHPDARADGPGIADGALDQVAPAPDAADDVATDGGSADAAPDTAPPVDAGTDFCTSTSPTPQQKAQHACAWLGACAGNGDLNEYGACYPLALQAYDCTLNPNQQVQGPLHAFWDQLWQATQCTDVINAVFGGVAPACTNDFAACGSDLVDGGVFGNVAVKCADAGYSAAVNCDMRGFTCSAGKCVLAGGGACAAAGSPAAGCVGTVMHSCQTIENDPGAPTPTSVVDVGKDCAHFGAGSCVATPGTAGCKPSGTATACTPSVLAACSPGDASTITGCATGLLESVRCGGFGAGAVCSVTDGGWFASSSDLERGCYNPASNGFNLATDTCSAAAAFSDYAGPSGNVTVQCSSEALGVCATSAASGSRPYCSHP